MDKKKNMKKVMLVIGLLLAIQVANAQLGVYYKTIIKKYQNDIVASDSISITVKTGNLTTYFYFKEGLCNVIYFYNPMDSEDDIQDYLTGNTRLKKSSKGDWYWYWISAHDGYDYHCIAELWYDDGNKPYIKINLNFKK